MICSLLGVDGVHISRFCITQFTLTSPPCLASTWASSAVRFLEGQMRCRPSGYRKILEGSKESAVSVVLSMSVPIAEAKPSVDFFRSAAQNVTA